MPVSRDTKQLCVKVMARVVAVAFGCLLLQGCPQAPPTEHPSITVSVGNNVLLISGQGFSNVNACAHLSLQGGQTHSVLIGDPSCSNGAFSNFAFPYSYGGCINPKSKTTTYVFAQDPTNNAGASQSIQIPWDTNCAVAGAACLNSGTACVACGGENEPVCSNNSASLCVQPTCTFQQQQNGTCTANLPDLHPSFSGGQQICTANCGHAQGYSPCYPYMDGCAANTSYPATLLSPQNTCVTAPNGLNQFSCFDNSTIQNTGDCTCVPSQKACAVNTSPGNGTCQSTPC